MDRVALRVSLGGHAVPEDAIRRRYDRGRRHFLETSVPLADEWGLWDNQSPPAVPLAGSASHSISDLKAILHTPRLREPLTSDVSESARLVLEASRAATDKMLATYRRLGIRVTPEMTLAPDEARAPAPPPEAP